MTNDPHTTEASPRGHLCVGQLRLFDPDELVSPKPVPWRRRRFAVEPVQAIARAHGWSKNVLVDRLGTSKRAWDRVQHGGVTGHTADRWACRLGRHPVELWDDWLDDT